jgi:hypothetical protein
MMCLSGKPATSAEPCLIFALNRKNMGCGSQKRYLLPSKLLMEAFAFAEGLHQQFLEQARLC